MLPSRKRPTRLPGYSDKSRRSFELFRTSMPDVDVTTFDELVQKAKLLLGLFEGAQWRAVHLFGSAGAATSLST
ncbi:hypothetical protein [Amycolatopsis sp. VC5-11]|uniref:hypothetical protein n=1 Tax=Amycolatopsis sp. VC5-11 TaxID=3120156 RepID=UPI0030082B09